MGSSFGISCAVYETVWHLQVYYGKPALTVFGEDHASNFWDMGTVLEIQKES
jgi:hypothetical protein